MDTGAMFGFMDIIVLGCGIYGLYSWNMLVNKHEIIKTFLIGGSNQPQDCTDIEGFANYMGPKLLILSVVMIVFGGISAYNDYVQSIGMIYWVLTAGFFAAIVWYCVMLRKADRMFFEKKNGTIKSKAMNKK